MPGVQPTAKVAPLESADSRVTLGTSGSSGGEEGPARLKMAVAEVVALTVTAHEPVPEQAPVQPAKMDPAAGVAVRVSAVPRAKGREQVPQLVDLYMKGDLDLEALVTRRIALDEVNDAFAAMERKEGIRTVITF